jgi:hypothetical protein
MVKRFISFVAIAALLLSCNNSGKKTASAETSLSAAPVKVEFAALVKNPDEFVGKNIIVEGKVVHVCKETGKKLFIVGENPDISLYIQAGENISKFPMELLGSTVSVEGIITKTGAAELAVNETSREASKEAKAATDPSKPMNEEACETEKARESQPALSNIVMEYKSHSVK